MALIGSGSTMANSEEPNSIVVSEETPTKRESSWEKIDPRKPSFTVYNLFSIHEQSGWETDRRKSAAQLNGPHHESDTKGPSYAQRQHDKSFKMPGEFSYWKSEIDPERIKDRDVWKDMIRIRLKECLSVEVKRPFCLFFVLWTVNLDSYFPLPPPQCSNN